ncbi:hypothetical protein DRE_04859 [Drechslerella stenobrocha 248]|uniref:J domain-containing protein n=1 Tax=Drechslerella stenobrocha 248 TaxID=1043628 RepID=W7I046_9PEZI|nr:hypothetical protein DRE_04859 [Drechslerella stenobrocha 248]
MSAKASGVDTSSSSSARNRDHQQGKQDREYTSTQKTAVDRVRKCKATAYYEILNIKVEADDGEIRKAYKKLALVMHPDKNGAPGADEAFKLIAKAFQVLSDPQKRAIYDKTGGDPESRNPGGSQAGGGGSPFAGFQGRGAGAPGRHPFTDEISPEELFNMFFGGGGGAFGGGGSFFDLGGGGPGIRIHRFGGPTPRRRPNANAADGDADAETSIGSTIIRLLPLILIFVFSLLSSILSGFGGNVADSTPSYNGPQIKFAARVPYTEKRLTPTYKIPFYVNPVDIANYPQTKLNWMDRFAEAQYVRGLQAACDREYEKKQERIQESQGWFFVDQKKLNDAMETPLTSCKRLNDLGVVRKHKNMGP